MVVLLLNSCARAPSAAPVTTHSSRAERAMAIIAECAVQAVRYTVGKQRFKPVANANIYFGGHVLTASDSAPQLTMRIWLKIYKLPTKFWSA